MQSKTSRVIFFPSVWHPKIFISHVFAITTAVVHLCETNNIRDRPNQFPTDEIKQQFKRFLTILSNVTYENLEDIPMNNTFGIASDDYMDLLYNLSAPFNPEISSGTSTKLFMIDTVTELGFCHSVNTKVAGYNSYR